MLVLDQRDLIRFQWLGTSVRRAGRLVVRALFYRRMPIGSARILRTV